MGTSSRAGSSLLTVMALALLAAPLRSEAVIDGVAVTSGTTVNLAVKQDYVTTADGNAMAVWAYAQEGKRAQYPGPTLIVKQGETVTITLTNQLPDADPAQPGVQPAMPVSMVFPGQDGVEATGGSEGLLTRESAGPADTVTYRFTAKRPGTYLYHSGTRPDLQVEMGMVGAIIVRPSAPGQAYDHAETAYDHEYLFLLTEMDPVIHEQVAAGQLAAVDTTRYFAQYWFINGRTGPDTLSAANVGWLPTQPYNALPRMHPGEKVLLRLIGAGRDLHPFHTHGNNMKIVAHDGRLLQSAPGAGPDLAYSDYTLQVLPGATYDALFEWTGKGLGFDIYGHSPTDPLAPNEYAPDHGKPFPVVLPQNQDLTFGGFYSGSPFLGTAGTLPPGEGGLNPNAGLVFMWHSHTEKELTNYDIFPGGMMSMLIIEPHGVPIP